MIRGLNGTGYDDGQLQDSINFPRVIFIALLTESPSLHCARYLARVNAICTHFGGGAGMASTVRPLSPIAADCQVMPRQWPGSMRISSSGPSPAWRQHTLCVWIQPPSTDIHLYKQIAFTDRARHGGLPLWRRSGCRM